MPKEVSGGRSGCRVTSARYRTGQTCTYLSVLAGKSLYDAGVDFDVPRLIADQVRSWSGGEPATPRHSATVILLRDASAGVEVFVVRRASSMASFAGMIAFPGGRGDPSDLDGPAMVPDPADWPLAADPRLSRALAYAAIRELFEEAGVLLAGPDPGDLDSEEWERVRLDLEAHRVNLSEALRKRGLVARSDLLRPWAHWITPFQEPRRYDTRFFVARLPVGQRARHIQGEAEHSEWRRPADVLDDVRRGAAVMVTPTVVTLRELPGYATVDDVWAAAADRRIFPVTPRLVADDEQVRVLLPGDSEYEK